MSEAIANDDRATSGTKPRPMVPALPKAFAILNLVAQEGGIGFTAIQKRLGLPKSTVHQMIATLRDLGALQQTSDGGYMLGLRLSELGAIAANQRTIERVALPFLKKLSLEVGMTCHLGVLEGDDPIYLAKVEAEQDIKINTWVGKRLSLYRSSLGKVLLAWQPEADLDRLLSGIEWVAKTPKSLPDEAAVRRHLVGVREAGWATDDEEDMLNVRCVSAPVFDRHHKVVAAISVVGTVLQVSPDDFPRLAERTCAVADDISRNFSGF